MQAKYLLVAGLLLWFQYSGAQELYVFTEPASNIPARSFSVKLSSNLAGKSMEDRNIIAQRYRPELMAGLSKNWMVKAGLGFSDFNSPQFRYESINLYSKYRFLTKDGDFSHFRMAAFADGVLSRSYSPYDEISLQGDRTAAAAGIVATQLLHRWAISSSLTHTQVLDRHRFRQERDINGLPFQAMDYSLSAGYLLLPRAYTDFRQTNLNLYTELLAQQSLDVKGYYLDLAPSVQLIFNSDTKLNLGYRIQIGGNMTRMATNSWLLSLEKSFFGFF